MSPEVELHKLSDEQVVVIEAIFQAEWGTTSLVPFGVIDRPLHQRGIDAQKTLHSLVPRFIHRRGSGPHFQAGEELGLTVLGAAQSSAGSATVTEFLKVLSFLVDVESDHRVPEDGLQPEASSEEVTGLLTVVRPRHVAKEIADRILLLISEERNIWTGINRNADGWSLTLSREIRRYAGVKTLDEYLERCRDGEAESSTSHVLAAAVEGDELSVDPKSVFVVHGRNFPLRDSMFTFLNSIGLTPIEWDQAVAMTGKGSPYTGEILDVAFAAGQAIVVLLSPDDVAYLRTEFASGPDDPELNPRGQARPNVLFEAGMAMGRNAERTILVEFGDLRPFSDAAGRHAIRMTNDPQMRKSLAGRLETAGCAVNLTGSHWMTAGDFTPPQKLGAGMPLGRRLPSTVRSGASVDGHWYSSGGSSIDSVKVTNNGAVPLLNVRLTIPDELAEHIKLYDAEPVAKLPVGKSFTVRGWTTAKTMQGGAPAQFELHLEADLENGSTFEQDVYFDAGG